MNFQKKFVAILFLTQNNLLRVPQIIRKNILRILKIEFVRFVIPQLVFLKI